MVSNKISVSGKNADAQSQSGSKHDTDPLISPGSSKVIPVTWLQENNG